MTERPVHDVAASAELAPVLAALRRHYRDPDEAVVAAAYEVARRSHHGQLRKSGEPFITHPLAVAQILADYGLDADTLAAALLHDTVEDTELTLDDVEQQFGPDVGRITDGVTKLDRITFNTREEAQAATIRKMVVAMAQDVRVLIIKLADRLHNMRTIDALPDAKQQEKALETLEVYAPLAHRLGVQEIKHEMENRCFAILHPGRYQEIEDLIHQRAPEREAVIDKVIGEIQAIVDQASIEAQITGRPKHHYSIYRKMVDTAQSFEDIHDLIGVRVVVPTEPDCYAVLGMIHAIWPPVHGRFKDYIAMPKFNLYQSIHTTVVGPDGKPLEVQIRTIAMHQLAEFGIAAHWRYKEGADAAMPWMADLRRLRHDYEDPTEFLDNLKLDLYQDEVFVLTPAGDVKNLPRGATPVDFAYSIHTEVGHRCSGARVNGRLVPLATRLESGDIVDIITTKAIDAGPTRDWLGFVRTSKARSKIKQWFTRARKETAVASGREKVYALLRREGTRLDGDERDRALLEIAKTLSYQDRDAMYGAVGDGALSPSTIATRLRRMTEAETPSDFESLAPVRRSAQRPAGEGVIVEGLDDVWVRVARCCNPVPGDDISGFVTVGRGVSVHRSDCGNVMALGERAERMIEVSWAPDRVGSFAVWFQVEALDRPNLLRDVTSAISDAGGNIIASSTSTDADRVATLRYEVELSDPGQVDQVLTDMRRVESVYEAYRLIPRSNDSSAN
ncbi:MAG: bifunctional (p)ppGpp synthetase/guanosine-3',5'-bis(diphosphate) 3'-pyrophosphohydrolase [Acidimicrobiia bacterium]|nr:bifunctional (p)ppGpp synthetase/guanosine-3',5'-bis(diphosphate) 3'-pyrophosphohydrolase [Acidimicrobiia bacterium]